MDSTHEDEIEVKPIAVDITPGREVKPIAVDIIPGREYPPEIWEEVVQSMEVADRLVAEMRAIKRTADLAYNEALELRTRVQGPRDQMIFTDPRTNAAVARLAGIGRARVEQLRTAHKGRVAKEK